MSAMTTSDGAAVTVAATRDYVGHLRILTVNDVYRDTAHNGLGGWAALSTLLHAHRTTAADSSSSNRKTIFAICGDILGGSMLAEHSSGAHVIDIINAIGNVDYITCGNHEFDFTAPVLQQRIQQCHNTSNNSSSNSQCKWLGSNIRDATPERPLFAGLHDCSTELLTLHRVDSKNTSATTTAATAATLSSDDTITATIGIFGVLTPKTPALAFPGPSVVFEDVLQHATRVISLLHHQHHADAIVAITHLHMSEDIELCLHAANTAAVAAAIDVVIGGHDHTVIAEIVPDTNTLLFKAGQNCDHLGIVDMTVTVTITPATAATATAAAVAEQRSTRIHCEHQMIVNQDIEQDAAILAIVAKRQAAVDSTATYSDLDEVICTVAHDSSHDAYHSSNSSSSNGSSSSALSALDTHSSTVRSNETVFAQLIADSMAYHYRQQQPLQQHNTGSDVVVAVINGGFIRRNHTYTVGTSLTIRDCQQECVFPKQSVLVLISGKQLTVAIEQMLRHWPENSGCFPSGFSAALAVACDYTKPPMQRVLSVTIAGVAVAADRVYTVAITTFMHGGGDECTAWTESEKISTAENEFKVVDLLIKYCRQVRHEVDPRMVPRLLLATSTAATAGTETAAAAAIAATTAAN